MIPRFVYLAVCAAGAVAAAVGLLAEGCSPYFLLGLAGLSVVINGFTEVLSVPSSQLGWLLVFIGWLIAGVSGYLLSRQVL